MATSDLDEQVYRERILEAIVRINREFYGARPASDVFEFLLSTVLHLTASEYGFIGHIFRAEDGSPYLKTRALTNIAWTNELRDWFEKTAPSGLEFRNLNTLFGQVMRTGKPLISNQAPSHPSAAGVPPGHPPLERFMGIPLHIGSELVGMLGIANRQAGYSQKLLDILEPLTGTIAQMLYSFELHHRRNQLELELREREERWNLALNGSGEGVWDWNLESGDIYLSPRWKSVLGYADHEIENSLESWQALIHPDDRKLALEDMRCHVAGILDHYENVHRLRHRNGQYRWFLDRGKVVTRTESGRPLRFVGTHTDITDKKRQENELIEARRTAESAAQAKTDFLAMMSHEIRTPMNAVIGMTSLLSDTPMTDEQAGFVQTIKDSGIALLGVINDILDFSKIESGKLELEQIQFDARALIEDVSRLIEGDCTRKGLQLKLDLPPEPTWIISDLSRLRQVALNLLSNALKFTQQGSISVRLRYDAQAARLSCSVEDTGIGVPEDKRSRLFQEFTQADVSTTREYGGTGLGLAISERLVTALHGTISFAPSPSGGAIFSFSIEAPPGENTSNSAEAANDKTPLSLPPSARVLVAEDNVVNQKVARALLERMHLQVDCVGNGLEALQALSQLPYDLVLMDAQMPEMDGYTATQHIRALDTPVRNIPIVALTASALVEERQRCFDAGMNEFLTKPIDKDTLQRTLARLLQAK